MWQFLHSFIWRYYRTNEKDSTSGILFWDNKTCMFLSDQGTHTYAHQMQKEMFKSEKAIAQWTRFPKVLTMNNYCVSLVFMLKQMKIRKVKKNKHVLIIENE